MEGLTYDIKKQSECVADIDIEVVPGRVNEEFERIYGNLKKKVRIPGFRQGKAPISLIKEKYKDEARMQILNSMSGDVLEEVMKKENINPATTPQINSFEVDQDKPFKISVKVEMYPEVTPRKYKKIKLDKKVYTVEDKDVDSTIERFRQGNATLKPKEGVSAKGDYAIVSITAVIDSVEVESGLPKETMVEIGSEFPMPGFSDNIAGMAKGESKDFQYEFFEDFTKEELRGKTADFSVTLNELKKIELPEESEIASSMGLKDAGELRDNIRKSLKEQMDRAAEKELDDEIVKYLVDKHSFDLPDGLVADRVEKEKEEMASHIKERGGDPSQMDDANIREKVIRDIKAGIILSAIAKEEDIKVEADDRKKEEDRLLSIIGEDNEENREKAKMYLNDSAILTNKVFDLIKENAKIKTIQQKTPEGGKDVKK